MSANLENSAVPIGLERVTFHSESKKGNVKDYSNYWKIAFISDASKVMLKIIKASLQQSVTKNFQMYKLNLEKAEEPEIKLPKSVGS